MYEAACAYFKANGLRTLPDLKKLDAEYQILSSEKNGFYTRYKKAQIELRELRTAQQNVEAFFRKEERSHAVPQQEVKSTSHLLPVKPPRSTPKNAPSGMSAPCWRRCRPSRTLPCIWLCT